MGIKIKKLRTNLKKEDIALSKGYMRWYRVVEDEVRLFINERAVNNNKEAVNKYIGKKIELNCVLIHLITLKSFMKNIRI